MCTVTLTPINGSENGFILTSNRDEASGRETLPPAVYSENGIKIFFPKDVEGGGTWLGVSEKKRVICLLNGEFEKHLRTPPYRLSRGVVVKDLLEASSLNESLRDYELQRVEPFTMICVEWEEDLKFTEFVWDGNKKHIRNLPLVPHIWSSSPLYTPAMKEQRDKWFQNFIEKHRLTSAKLLQFHSSAGVGDKNIDVIMDRGPIKTQSISQIKYSEGRIVFYYEDLTTGEVSKKVFSDEFSELI